MSCQETCIGQVEEVSLNRIDSLLESLGKTPDKIKLMTPEDKVDYLYDHDICILCVKGRFFEYINEERHVDEPDVYYMSRPSSIDPKKMTYVVSFYNGGTCLSEVLTDMIKERI